MSDFVDRARALDKAATAGPWETEGSGVYGPTADTGGVFGEKYEPLITDCEVDYDAEFIASARTMLPAAVEALARVRELHRPVDVEPSETICHECSTLRGTGENKRYFPYEEWPCATYQATEVEG